MADKLSLRDMSADRLESITNYNSNNTDIEDAIDNTLSRDGTSPNQMAADIDLNGYELLNAALRLRSYAATVIADSGNSVNTSSKAVGTIVWDTTNNRIMVSSGTAPTDAWYTADGATSVTPS